MALVRSFRIGFVRWRGVHGREMTAFVVLGVNTPEDSWRLCHGLTFGRDLAVLATGGALRRSFRPFHQQQPADVARVCLACRGKTENFSADCKIEP